MKRIGLRILFIALFLGCSGNSATNTSSDVWEPVRPQKRIRVPGDSHAVVILQTDPGVAVTVQQVPKEEGVEYRPYLVKNGRRVKFSPSGMISTDGISAAIFSATADDGIAAGQARLGLERLTPAGRRELSLAAFDEARGRGFPVLPAPEPGKPYRFRLKTHSGEFLDSESLRGRVVLIDCWATWCSPCMALMPSVIELTKTAGDRLVVVSVTLDEDAEEALKKLRAAHGDTVDRWRHVAVPSDFQELWSQSIESRSIPKLLLIDPEGMLQKEPFPQPEALKKAVLDMLVR